MAARKRSSGEDASEEGPRLTEPLASVVAKITERIERGRALLPASRPISTVDALKARKYEYDTWNDYNHTLLRRLLGAGADSVYRDPYSFGGSSDPNTQTRELQDDVEYYLRQLESVVERLPLWQDVSAGPSRASADVTSDQADGPIFVVHGSDIGRANEVARLLERCTDRGVVILHEQPNRGLTLLEKFEQHAGRASFAVVVLTADDEGRRRDAGPLQPRGRQNVIFEMGFFFALLGRERVVVLLDASVEQPSDTRGLVYQPLEAGDGWRHALLREVAAAGVAVDFNKFR